MAGRIAALLAGLAARSRMAHQIAGERHWEPMVRPGMMTPLQMRKRADDGRWVYREPTEAEIRSYLEGEAW